MLTWIHPLQASLALFLLCMFVAAKSLAIDQLLFFDVFLHISGGVWVGACALLIIPYVTEWLEIPKQSETKITVVVVFSIVLVVGLAWEVVTVIIDVLKGKNLLAAAYPLDTIKDVCMDLLGAHLLIKMSPKHTPA